MFCGLQNETNRWSFCWRFLKTVKTSIRFFFFQYINNVFWIWLFLIFILSLISLWWIIVAVSGQDMFNVTFDSYPVRNFISLDFCRTPSRFWSAAALIIWWEKCTCSMIMSIKYLPARHNSFTRQCQLSQPRRLRCPDWLFVVHVPCSNKETQTVEIL